MTIDAYLAQLERRLPRIARRRILAEAQEHLRDSAARHSAAGLLPHTAEAAAVDDFGPVEIVARRLAAEGATSETRIATLVALGAVAFFVFPLYVVPENTLHPAPGRRCLVSSPFFSQSLLCSGSSRARLRRRAPSSLGRAGLTSPRQCS